MGKSYVMFINSEILYENNNPIIAGIVFEEEYYTSKLNQNSELKDIVEKYSGEKDIRNEDILQLSTSLEYKIIINRTKNNNLSYEEKIENLLKTFNKYIKKIEGERGKIIFEDNKNVGNIKRIQRIFDIYDKCRSDTNALDMINAFMIYEKDESKYNNAFETCKIIYKIVQCLDDEEIDYSVSSCLKDKYFDNDLLYNSNNEIDNNFQINKLLYQIETLNKEVVAQNKNITTNNLTINKLKEEILALKEQIKLMLKNKDNVKMKIFENNIENKYSEV